MAVGRDSKIVLDIKNEIDDTWFMTNTQEMKMTVERWYVRCVDCLSIGAVETNPAGQRWTCGVCEGQIETMGKVVLDHLETEHVRSACDARCTHARGPLCTCRCNCANHGSGRVVHVVVKSNLPAIDFTEDITTALAHAIEYRDTVKSITAEMTARTDIRYYGLYRAKQLMQKARDARKHDTRMKRLTEARAAIPPRIIPVAAPAPAPVPAAVPVMGFTTPARPVIRTVSAPTGPTMECAGGCGEQIPQSTWKLRCYECYRAGK